MSIKTKQREISMITVKELKDKLEDCEDELVIRFYGYIEGGRGGSYDSDCSVSIEVNETEIICEVSGDESSESGGYD